MIVVDASAAVLGLLNDSEARQFLADEPVAVPHVADIEVASVLRAQVRGGTIPERAGRLALDRWIRLGIRRFPATGLVGRVWSLRDNLSAYDAVYVALAEALACGLLTADTRLGRAPGPTCPITIVRR